MPFKNIEHLRKRKHLLPAGILTFLYLFGPMLFTVEIAPTPQASGSPASEQKLQDPARMFGGAGGPEETDIIEIINDTIELKIENPDRVLYEPDYLGYEVKSDVEPKIYRINYKNYANIRMPVDETKISSDYGWRTPPCSGCSADHKGVDFIPGAGEPIYAILDGMVLESGYLGGYGYWVQLEHLVNNPAKTEPERWVTVYAHMQEDSIPEEVTVGSVVKQGDILGKVGNTGMSTGPHLHFEIRIDGEQLDPLPLISRYQEYSVSKETKEIEERFAINY